MVLFKEIGDFLLFFKIVFVTIENSHTHTLKLLKGNKKNVYVDNDLIEKVQLLLM